jgi:hypothetical protein
MCDTQRQAQELPAHSIPAAVWETEGITEYMGGLKATQRLVDLCEVGHDWTVVDIGCGRGGMACYLAETFQTRVFAAGFSRRNIAEERRLVAARGLVESVKVVLAKAQVKRRRSGSRLSRIRRTNANIPAVFVSFPRAISAGRLLVLGGQRGPARRPLSGSVSASPAVGVAAGVKTFRPRASRCGRITRPLRQPVGSKKPKWVYDSLRRKLAGSRNRR